MSDTPETDAVCWDRQFDGTECVEARAALRELWQSADAFLPHFDSETIARWRKAAGWEGEE